MTTTKKARLAPWSADENRAIVRLYFDMLNSAANGAEYNKAAMIRAVQNNHSGPIDSGLNTAALKVRSKGSIEAKLMNCTAAHRDLIAAGELPDVHTMDGHGYRALSNYQATLKVALRDWVKAARYGDPRRATA